MAMDLRRATEGAVAITATTRSVINENTITTLEEMKNIDVRLVDPNTLADYGSVQVNTSLPKDEQIMDYFKQIKNPYCFKVGKAIVKISHADTESTMEDCLERYLLSL